MASLTCVLFLSLCLALRLIISKSSNEGGWKKREGRKRDALKGIYRTEIDGFEIKRPIPNGDSNGGGKEGPN